VVIRLFWWSTCKRCRHVSECQSMSVWNLPLYLLVRTSLCSTLLFYIVSFICHFRLHVADRNATATRPAKSSSISFSRTGYVNWFRLYKILLPWFVFSQSMSMYHWGPTSLTLSALIFLSLFHIYKLTMLMN
jgi:hypothetical protein